MAVDDSAPIREMISSLLAQRVYRVMTAESGYAALDLLRLAHEPHIILLDVVMPGLDGVGVMRAINDDAALRSAAHRVILMSSPLRLAARDIPESAAQLPKPFTRQQLLHAVEALVS